MKRFHKKNVSIHLILTVIFCVWSCSSKPSLDDFITSTHALYCGEIISIGKVLTLEFLEKQFIYSAETDSYSSSSGLCDKYPVLFIGTGDRKIIDVLDFSITTDSNLRVTSLLVSTREMSRLQPAFNVFLLKSAISEQFPNYKFDDSQDIIYTWSTSETTLSLSVTDLQSGKEIHRIKVSTKD